MTVTRRSIAGKSQHSKQNGEIHYCRRAYKPTTHNVERSRRRDEAQKAAVEYQQFYHYGRGSE